MSERPINKHSIDLSAGGRTHQSFKEECDINHMMTKWQRTGGIPPNTLPLQYGDFTNVASYQEALQQIMDAEDAFASLPSNIRKRFNHDARQFVEFMDHAENTDEAIKLGLAEPRPKAETPAEPETADTESATD